MCIDTAPSDKKVDTGKQLRFLGSLFLHPHDSSYYWRNWLLGRTVSYLLIALLVRSKVMKTNVIAFVGVSVLVLFVAGFASIFEIRLASAQVNATSSSAIDSTTTPLVPEASTSSTPIADAASSTPASAPANDSASTTVATSSSSTSAPGIEPPPKGLTKVQIIGTKYIDYFTDGTTTFAFPGDPAIDSHFNVPNAPTPTHEGLTWVHTTGQHLYDTPSGDLEVGEYAVQADNSYIASLRP
jgi:hypothetical protein